MSEKTMKMALKAFLDWQEGKTKGKQNFYCKDPDCFTHLWVTQQLRRESE